MEIGRGKICCPYLGFSDDAVTHEVKGVRVMRSVFKVVHIAVAVLVLSLASVPTRAIEIRLSPEATSPQVSDVFSIDLVADMGDESVIGWGLDLAFDDTILTLTEPPTIGPYWDPVFAPDGDGLAAAANPFADPDGDGVFGSVSGDDILLATLTFSANALGQTFLTPSVTDGDLNEGFALDPIGFASLLFDVGEVVVVPEPATLLIASLALLGFWRRHTSSSNANM